MPLPGQRRGLEAFEPDTTGRRVLGIIVAKHGHYTARIRYRDDTVLHLESLEPLTCRQLKGAEITADQDDPQEEDPTAKASHWRIEQVSDPDELPVDQQQVMYVSSRGDED